MTKHLNIIISGRVQGVGFRAWAQTKANELNLAGFTRNEPDGTVYIEAEGEKENLENFLNWCKKGTIFARVEKVEFEYSSIMKNFRNFEIH